jgi:SSS family solute:Na+ symporter
MIGGFVLYWGLFYKGNEDIWDYMAVTGAIYFTGAFALLLGGLYWKRASSTGAFIALIGGLGAIVGLTPVQDLLGIDYSSARVGLLSIIGTLVLMIIGSLLFPDRIEQKEPKTISNHVT